MMLKIKNAIKLTYKSPPSSALASGKVFSKLRSPSAMKSTVLMELMAVTQGFSLSSEENSSLRNAMKKAWPKPSRMTSSRRRKYLAFLAMMHGGYHKNVGTGERLIERSNKAINVFCSERPRLLVATSRLRERPT